MGMFKGNQTVEVADIVAQQINMQVQLIRDEIVELQQAVFSMESRNKKLTRAYGEEDTKILIEPAIETRIKQIEERLNIDWEYIQPGYKAITKKEK